MKKRIQKRDEGIDFIKQYSLQEALGLLKERSTTKFDETVEVIFSCNVDPRKGDQNIRGMVALPRGTGKSVRVAVFAEGAQLQEAKDAGSDCYGGIEFIEEVERGRMDFDLCIATPSMMARLGKLGKVLGPKGLMPNPKLGTVTMDVGAAVKAAKAGQVSLRADKAGIVHGILGKISFSLEALEENFRALKDALLEMKPSSIKGEFLKKMHLSSTMGFALSLDMVKSGDLAFKSKT